MAKANRAPRQRRVAPAWKLALLRPVLRWSNGRGAFVLRFVGNSVGPVYVRVGEGGRGSPPETWVTPPIPLHDYEDGAAAAGSATAPAGEPDPS